MKSENKRAGEHHEKCPDSRRQCSAFDPLAPPSGWRDHCPEARWNRLNRNLDGDLAQRHLVADRARSAAKRGNRDRPHAISGEGIGGVVQVIGDSSKRRSATSRSIAM